LSETRMVCSESWGSYDAEFKPRHQPHLPLYPEPAFAAGPPFQFRALDPNLCSDKHSPQNTRHICYQALESRFQSDGSSLRPKVA
jgi:hypothetical protein